MLCQRSAVSCLIDGTYHSHPLTDCLAVVGKDSRLFSKKGESGSLIRAGRTIFGVLFEGYDDSLSPDAPRGT